MKSERDRGRWGTWLRAERLKRGLSPEQVREMLAARGYRVGESTYAEWESGYKKQPARDAIPHLVALWNSEPPPEQATDQPDVAAAINALTVAMQAQAAAMQAIVAEMRLARETTQGRSEGMAAALGDLAGTLESLRSELAERQGSRSRQ